MTKKYELTDDTLEVDGHTLHRIKALRSFADVHEGDLGGWIESEDNLSHEGYCWVYDNAKVFDRARVYGNAKAHGNAEILGRSQAYGNAEVYDNADMEDAAQAYGNAKVFENAYVADNGQVFGDARIRGNATVLGDAVVFGHVEMSGNAYVKCIGWWNSMITRIITAVIGALFVATAGLGLGWAMSYDAVLVLIALPVIVIAVITGVMWIYHAAADDVEEVETDEA